MKRYDVDGNECDLLTLCKRDPNWAASRIQHMEQQLVEASADKTVLEGQIRHIVALIQENGCNCNEGDCELCLACRIALELD